MCISIYGCCLHLILWSFTFHIERWVAKRKKEKRKKERKEGRVGKTQINHHHGNFEFSELQVAIWTVGEREKESSIIEIATQELDQTLLI